jgi:hypothetical protein
MIHHALSVTVGSGGSVSVARVFQSYNNHSRTRSSTVESRVCAVYSSEFDLTLSFVGLLIFYVAEKPKAGRPGTGALGRLCARGIVVTSRSPNHQGPGWLHYCHGSLGQSQILMGADFRMACEPPGQLRGGPARVSQEAILAPVLLTRPAGSAWSAGGSRGRECGECGRPEQGRTEMADRTERTERTEWPL